MDKGIMQITETVSQLVTRLAQAKVKLWAEGDRLRYDAPAQAMTPAVLEALRARKPEILAFLHQEQAAAARKARLAAWQQQLADAPPLLKLPPLLKGPLPQAPIASGTVATCAIQLSAELSEALRTFSRATATPLSTIFLTALATVLFRYSGQTDLLLGLLAQSEANPDAQGCDPAVLRLDLAGNPAFHTLLTQAQAVRSTAQQQSVPFAQLVAALTPEKAEQIHPLVQVLLAWECPVYTPPAACPAPDLQLELHAAGAELVGQWHYRPDHIDEGTVVRMGGHLQTLLAGVVADAHNTIEQLPLLTAAERQMILVDWNQTQAAYDLDIAVHELFEARVARAPEAVAVVFGDAQLTYCELNQQANQLAHYLLALGVGPENLVGVFVERSLDVVVAMLAIFKAGGAYLPLDPAYPPDRLAFMLEDTAATLLLTKQKWLDCLPPHQAKVIVLDAEQATIAGQPVDNPNRPVRGEHLAYLIYTSGSTGQPKGVATEYRSLTNYINHDIVHLRLTPQDRMTQFFSLSFDASIAEILVPICAGARLYVLTEDEVLQGAALLALIKTQAITYLFLTPSVMATLANVDPAEFPALRGICTGGENCTPELVKHWSTGRSFFNIYGPTEFTMAAMFYDCTPHDVPPPIGRIYDNCQAYVLDHDMQPAPIGVAGELYLGGAQLARGYFKRPELTAEKFVTNPFGPPENPGRLYKTGDLVTFRADGNIVFVGREDGMVKVRGLRIELGEIEAALHEHPAVQQAVVSTVKDNAGRDQQLVAYVVPATNGATNDLVHVTASELNRFASQKLPAYMLPSSFVFLPVFPLTPSGKVDRRALPPPNSAGLVESAGKPVTAPRTPTEAIIAEIWCELLRLQQVGIDENFFELGGHSLLVMQVISRLKSAFPVVFPVRELFNRPTIAEVAELIDTLTIEQADSDLLAKLLIEVPV